ncbi:MAG: HsdM family class I SAM-dependent methyltransferase [Planctomycetota bacterium]
MNEGILESVGLAPEPPHATDGLVAVDDPPAGLAVNEAALVRDIQVFHLVDYVFFRRFDDGRSSQPAAFVIDNTTERFTKSDLAKAHHDLWLHGAAPLVYIAWPTRIDVLSCARGPDFWDDGERRYWPAAEINAASQVEAALAERRRFSARRLADGTFWEDPGNQPLADHERAAQESLIRTVVDVDETLDGEANPASRRLLLLTVLVKYLEDRGVFPRSGWFGRFRKGARSFLDVLNGGEPDEVSALLNALERKFNGDVFCLPKGETLTRRALHNLADLVEARTIGDQRYLWDVYSFDHLSVEVISHLYERFVQGNTAVYTPPFLASLLLDYAMPYDKLTGDEQVLDPACGSGVFLVGAFRRLVNAWRAKNQWQTPDVTTLKGILRNQIFGVELESDAIHLTAFSLALAVCDSLRPNVIWSELRFDRLYGENLWEGDFFEEDMPGGEKPLGQAVQFDCVIGNPPFESKFSEAAKRVNAAHVAQRGEVPDKQIAYLFLDQGLRLLRSGGRLCLIQPSGFLYNLRSHDFRSGIVKTGKIDAVLDFTSVRGLYEGADPKTIAVLASSAANPRDWFLHLTFRRTYKTAQRIGFELDHYDRHRLSVEDVVVDKMAARVNLLGGGRLAALSARFQKMRTLANFVRERGWLMGEGFIEEGTNKQPGDHLTGKPLLPTRALTDEGIDAENLDEVTATSFHTPCRAALFQPPLVLIRENESLPLAYWDKSVLAFKDKIVGIHAPWTEKDEHKQFYDRLQKHHKCYRFAVMLYSSQSLIGKATAVIKRDIDRLPYPENERELELTFWEQVLADDTLEHFADYVRRGQKSELLKQKADANALRDYASLYHRLLGSLYTNLQASDPIFLDGLTCQPFFFGDEPGLKWLNANCEQQLTNLVFEQTLPSLRTVRVVRFYHDNVVFVIKPDRLRYWIRSTAIWDADDTLTELRQQGY